MQIKIVGLDNIKEILKKVGRAISSRVFAKEIADLLEKFVHVQTGELRDSIYFNDKAAGANAPYGFVEVERGGSHDFASLAIAALRADAIVSEGLRGIL